MDCTLRSHLILRLRDTGRIFRILNENRPLPISSTDIFNGILHTAINHDLRNTFPLDFASILLSIQSRIKLNKFPRDNPDKNLQKQPLFRRPDTRHCFEGPRHNLAQKTRKKRLIPGQTPLDR